MTFEEMKARVDSAELAARVEEMKDSRTQPYDTSDETFLAGLIVLRLELTGESSSSYLVEQAEAGADTPVSVQWGCDESQRAERKLVAADFVALAERELPSRQADELRYELQLWL